VTFPRSVGQLPVFYNSDPSRRHKYVDDDGEPLFHFGFGLSYTKFGYEHLEIHPPPPRSSDDIQLSVDVTNLGEREGDEVAQLYLTHNVSSVETPSRSLVGFSRVRLGPGQTRTVAFRVPQARLAIWSASKRWTIEAGSYTLFVGGSSEASLSGKVVIEPQQSNQVR